MRIVPIITVILLAIGVTIAAMLIEAPKIEQRITAEARDALDGLGFSAEIDGRDATLIGVARDEEHRDSGLIRLAAIDEIDVLRDHTVVPSHGGPYTLSAARLNSGEVFLHGVLPDPAARAALLDHFEEAGLGPVRDFTRMVSGAPEGWTERAVAAVSALDALEQGSALIVDDEVTISGLYSEENSAAAFSRLSTPGWRVHLLIDQRNVVDALTTQTDALRADLLDAAEALDAHKIEAEAQAATIAAEIKAAQTRIDTLEGLLGEEAATQTTDSDQ